MRGSPARPSRAGGRHSSLALVVIALDQLSKGIVRGSLEPGERIDLFLGVDLVLVSNSGIAFGFLGDGGTIVLVVTHRRARRDARLVRDRAVARPGLWIAVGLLAGGALGNLIDRIRVDAVTDFIDPPLWPAFNVADIAITFGAIALVLSVALGRGAGAGAPDDRSPRARPLRRLAGRDRQARRPGRPRGARTPRERPSSTCWADLLGGGDDPVRPGIVHRLDKDTSGLMIVARTDESHRRLSDEDHRRTRSTARYLALVEGRPKSRSGTIDAPLGRDHRAPERRAVGGRGARDARTHFEVVETFPADTLVEARLETGRTHQIRAHFAAIGHPVCGDPRYGARRPPRPRAPVPAQRAPGFAHPMTARRLEFACSPTSPARERAAAEGSALQSLADR